MMKVIFLVILFAAGVLTQLDKRIWIERYPCPKLCYTQWFDRDNPSGYGDYETLLHLRTEYPGRICKKPYAIEVQTLSGETVNCPDPSFAYCDTVNGFVCLNMWKPIRKCCLDYKVRFVCPCNEIWYVGLDAVAKETGILALASNDTIAP